MRLIRVAYLACLPIVATQLWAQQPVQIPSTASREAQLVLQQAQTALTGTVRVADVILNGTANRVVGSDNETGGIELKALSSGQSLITGTYPSGRRSEARSSSLSGNSLGTWSGPDGAAHSMAGQNLLTDATWFFPAFTLGNALASQSFLTKVVGQETNAGVLVTHLTTSQTFPDFEGEAASQLQRLSQMDLFLDAKLLLPIALDFNIHPDDDLLIDIPVEIRFSDYRSVSGVQVPFHIQKYLNNSLILDIQVQSATLNSGLAATSVAFQ